MTGLAKRLIQRQAFTALVIALLVACTDRHEAPDSALSASTLNIRLAEQILTNPLLTSAQQCYRDTLAEDFAAGGHYRSVWIRDFNTFLAAAARHHGKYQAIRDALFVFLDFQGEDGRVIDGYVERKSAYPGIDYQASESQPGLIAFTNTVETDQETSLVQAFAKYVQLSGDRKVLTDERNGQPVLARLEAALEYLMSARRDPDTGLLWGGTTADWGDVQPETSPGTVLDENSHLAIDIYDNAMFLLAVRDLLSLLYEDGERRAIWEERLRWHQQQTRALLWDDSRGKFRPHLYLESSPFDSDLDELSIYFHGGTAVAAQAGLLSEEELRSAYGQLRRQMLEVGAQTVGLTISPAYPDGTFANPVMGEYEYQNGGEWDWFGCRWVSVLAQHGAIEQAYVSLQPILQRQDAVGLYEWYTLDGEPRGANPFKGSAGVCDAAIQDLRTWANSIAGSSVSLAANLGVR